MQRTCAQAPVRPQAVIRRMENTECAYGRCATGRKNLFEITLRCVNFTSSLLHQWVA